jgi:hypothetical protein
MEYEEYQKARAQLLSIKDDRYRQTATSLIEIQMLTHSLSCHLKLIEPCFEINTYLEQQRMITDIKQTAEDILEAIEKGQKSDERKS